MNTFKKSYLNCPVQHRNLTRTVPLRRHNNSIPWDAVREEHLIHYSTYIQLCLVLYSHPDLTPHPVMRTELFNLWPLINIISLSNHWAERACRGLFDFRLCFLTVAAMKFVLVLFSFVKMFLKWYRCVFLFGIVLQLVLGH